MEISDVKKSNIRKLVTSIYVDGYNAGLTDDLKKYHNVQEPTIDSEVNRRIKINLLLILQEIESIK